MTKKASDPTQSSSIIVDAPASSANLGPGFDVFALALAEPSDRLMLRAKASSRHDTAADIRVMGTGSLKSIETSPENNAASAVVLKMAKEFELRYEISLVLHKGVPIGVGLGSSAASSAAAAFAMNEHFRLRLGPSELVKYAAHGEFVSSGVEHYDNVSASLMGGFVIVEDAQRGRVHKFEPPPSLTACLATPKVQLPKRKTEYARSILPREIKLGKLAVNIAAASSMVAGFARGDIETIGCGMTRDEVVEPARSSMIPGYAAVRRAALDSGASGVCISGAGPTMIAVMDSRRVSAELVLKSMLDSFRVAGAPAEGFITKPGRGARVVPEGRH